jgi:hypothetical protein
MKGRQWGYSVSAEKISDVQIVLVLKRHSTMGGVMPTNRLQDRRGSEGSGGSGGKGKNKAEEVVARLTTSARGTEIDVIGDGKAVMREREVNGNA